MTAASNRRFLYRILSFDRLVQILRTGGWYFAHPSQWEDPYERRISTAATDTLFAQCWCRNGVSDAMWRIYSPDRLGVRIRVQKSKFEAALDNELSSQDFRFKIQAVKYLNPLEELAFPSSADSMPSFFAASSHLFQKRLAFSHEEETRIVIQSASGANTGKGFVVKLDSRKLIDSVLVDPRAPAEFVDAYKLFLRKELKCAFSVQKSRLYDEPQKREA